MKCNKCSKDIPDNVKFCPYCGAKIEQDQNELLYLKAAKYEDNLEIDKAFNIYSKLANEGDAKAMAIVGVYYINGLGRDVDYKKAASFFKKAVELKNPDAMFYLALMYDEGKGVFVNKDKCGKLMTEAANLGVCDAYSWIGFKCLYGDATTQPDYETAMHSFNKAIELGSVDANYGLGLMFLNGVYVKKDINKAIELFETAAKGNHQDAINQLNDLSLRGYYNSSTCLRLKNDYLVSVVDASKIDEYIKIAAEDLNKNLLNDACTNLRRIAENICNQILVNYENAQKLDLIEKIKVINKLNILDKSQITLLSNLRIIGNKGTHENFEIISEQEVQNLLAATASSYKQILRNIMTFYSNQPKIINI